MALFNSNNPVLSEKKLQSTVIPHDATSADSMTIRGTINKFGFLLFMVMASALYSWRVQSEGGNAVPLIWGGLIGGFIVALVIVFKTKWAPYLAPLYGLLEGLFIGAISAVFNTAFAEKAPNIIFNAVGLTIGVCVAMFLLYSFRVIRVTNMFRSIIFSATAGIAIFYLIVMVMRAFGFSGMAFLHEGTPLGIGFSLVVVGIAALNLMLDFDMIENGVKMGAPKYMEWFCAFGLLVTIVWLYLEILRLLSKLSSRN